ncbi:MAG: hypothetical protein GYA55_13295, partial [SAR324 cluster bacterium]|nr:hypothetical protein [SAR324 cluster bacterium]
MRRVIQISLFIVLCGSMASLLPGCGSSNNDQGMSFTAIGYNAFKD